MRAGGQFLLERFFELRDVLRRDLIERAEALRVVRPAEHQPVVRARLEQHLLGHGWKRRLLRADERSRRKQSEDDGGHDAVHGDTPGWSIVV